MNKKQYIVPKKRNYILKIITIIIVVIIGAAVYTIGVLNNSTIPFPKNETKDKSVKEAIKKEKQAEAKKQAKQIKKGYGLPVNKNERKEAKTDCTNIMELYSDIYKYADKGESANVVLSDNTIFKIQNKIKKTGYPVTTSVAYSNMNNYKEVDNFLQDCMKGKSGSVVIYEVHFSGGIGREKYIFDGTDMYVLSTNAIWNQENAPEIIAVSYTRIKEWEYTKKGWFGYELCVPEPPEVSEIVDGNCFIRIKPLSEEQRDMSIKCVQTLGYSGNNLLWSNWDVEHMEGLDYNGVYEYLYVMKYKKIFPEEKYADGIPKDEFETLIMEYLPVTAEQIQKYAQFDKKKQTYIWVRLGCLNNTLTSLGTALPEVVDIKEKKDGTVVLTVEAVCDMVMCNDELITHELTVCFREDGSFQYLRNKIQKDGMKNIPDYQYRVE